MIQKHKHNWRRQQIRELSKYLYVNKEKIVQLSVRFTIHEVVNMWWTIRQLRLTAAKISLRMTHGIGGGGEANNLRPWTLALFDLYTRETRRLVVEPCGTSVVQTAMLSWTFIAASIPLTQDTVPHKTNQMSHHHYTFSHTLLWINNKSLCKCLLPFSSKRFI
jgi:hypothetical protein